MGSLNTQAFPLIVRVKYHYISVIDRVRGSATMGCGNRNRGLHTMASFARPCSCNQLVKLPFMLSL